MAQSLVLLQGHHILPILCCPPSPDPRILQVEPSFPPGSACSSLPTPQSLLMPLAGVCSEFIALDFGSKKEEKFWINVPSSFCLPGMVQG